MLRRKIQKYCFQLARIANDNYALKNEMAK